jgi:hypothetical protein
MRAAKMNEQENGLRDYMVSIAAVEGTPSAYRVSYIPRGLQHERGASGRPKGPPEFKAQVKTLADAPVTWDKPPAKEEGALGMFNQDARKRALALHIWLERLNSLIGSVRTWADELGWATKVIEKPMEDSEIGSYKAPALLLQEETTRVLLEPISRVSPGAEGVVDLYRMPAYDDIASLYYYGNKWNIHYMPEGGRVVGNLREAKSKPLSKASLRTLLEEMKTHAE